MPNREFRIPVRRRWTLWILPALATIYFIAVLFLGATDRRVRGVSNQTLVWIGLALFALVVLVEIPFFLTRRARSDLPAQETDWQEEPAEPRAVPPMDRDDEAVATGESQQGLQVLEYSRPAKSRNKGSVYAKTYVPVTKEHVLRVETLAAEPADL